MAALTPSGLAGQRHRLLSPLRQPVGFSGTLRRPCTPDHSAGSRHATDETRRLSVGQPCFRSTLGSHLRSTWLSARPDLAAVAGYSPRARSAAGHHGHCTGGIDRGFLVVTLSGQPLGECVSPYRQHCTPAPHVAARLAETERAG